MKRRVALLVVALMLGLAAPASAMGPYYTYNLDTSWDADTGVPRGWKGSSCGGRAVMILFRDTNYNGMHTRVCRSEATLCRVPMEPYGDNLDTGQCYAWGTDWFNDWASSIKVTYLQPGWCIFIHEDADFQRAPKLYAQLPGSDPDLGNLNDKVSSIHIKKGTLVNGITGCA